MARRLIQSPIPEFRVATATILSRKVSPMEGPCFFSGIPLSLNHKPELAQIRVSLTSLNANQIAAFKIFVC